MSFNIGKSISRLEGFAKVTGKARYAADYHIDGLLHGCIISSTVTKGKIKSIRSARAQAVPGFVYLLTHENRPKVAFFDAQYKDMDTPPGKPFRPLYDETIYYNGQPIALVIAETFEAARYAASLVEVEYETEYFETNIRDHIDRARYPKTGMAQLFKQKPPKPKGNFEKAYAASAAQYEGHFFHEPEHHNPIELFATTTIYEGEGKLTIYDKTQGVSNCQLYVANVFGLRFKDVRVIAPYVGGAFGSGLRPQYQLFLCVMAALELKRHVKVVMDRSQMFSFGHRPATLQRIRFGADSNGHMNALNHTAWGETSRFEDYNEVVVDWSNMLYPAKNTFYDYKIVPIDMYTPLDMRAPGGSTGLHAIEVAVDELAHQLKIDPLQFRLINYSERDESKGKPFSSKELKECYRQGAEKFGWEKRNPEHRSMKRGKKLVGWGMATGIWEAMQVPAKAKATLNKIGQLNIFSSIADIGTGTKTVMTQIAADELGLPLDDVTFGYGDSDMPIAPLQGGSWTVSSIGSAVKMTCEGLRKKLWTKARALENSPFEDLTFEDVIFKDKKIIAKNDENKFVRLVDIMVANKGKEIKSTQSSIPKLLKLKKYARAAHSAAFVEVEVDEELGVVQVTRAVTAVAAGKIINPKTARSQILGGMIWGISKTLHEESVVDHRYGRIINQNIAEYHIPVHADIHQLDVIFVEEKDEIVNPLGTKGVGEIGLVAMPPAISNAIFHATGKRINDLPITLDKLL